jgi:hypothetical protein
MLLQENLKRLLERHLPVMLRLSLNVLRCVRNAGDSDAECAVAFLPLEVPMFFEPELRHRPPESRFPEARPLSAGQAALGRGTNHNVATAGLAQIPDQRARATGAGTFARQRRPKARAPVFAAAAGRNAPCQNSWPRAAKHRIG